MTDDILRIDIVLVPAEPLFSAVVAASQAITDRFLNYNIIDATKYPPHVSLHICYIRTDALTRFLDQARILISSRTSPVPLKDLKLERGSRGYISLRTSSTELTALHGEVIHEAAAARGDIAEPLPRSFDSYSDEDKANFRKFGNAYVGSKFDPHLSVAQVDTDNQEAAAEIADAILVPISEGTGHLFQVCDIGPTNEKWDVLLSEPLST